MYNPDYINWGPIGWTCPKCGRTYSPSTSMCLYCHDPRVVWATTTAKPEWIYKEDTTTGSVLPTMSWQDAVWLEKFRDDC